MAYLVEPKAFENGVLLVSFLPVMIEIYHTNQSEDGRYFAICLGLIALVCSLLENIKFHNALNRNGSSGLFYGYVLIAAIVLQISKDVPSFTSFEELTVFSVWIILYSVSSWLLPRFFSTTNMYIQCFLLIIMTGCFMHLLIIPTPFKVFLRVLLFLVFVEKVSRYLPNCFTFGEILILYNLVTTFMSNLEQFKSNFQLTAIGIWVLFFVLLFLTSLIPASLLGIMSIWYFYSSGLLFLACLLIVLSESLLPNAIIWTINFLNDNWPKRQLLLLLWVTEIIISTLYVTCWRKSKNKSSTSERKFFHVFILLTYIPGIWYDMPLIFLCSIGAFCLLIILEAMRVLKMPPFSAIINDSFSVFLDPQDSGCLILTPIYLLLGQSLPIWISCLQSPILLTHQPGILPISVYSGILSVGIGDTAASVIGSNFGKCKWAKTNKTVEGTFAAILMQIIFAALLVEINLSALHVFVAIISVSLIEAFTHQIDNLILPIYMYFLLNIKR